MSVKRPNIILVTIDSLRADRLSCYGYLRPTSPNIDALAREGVTFRRAFSTGPNTPHAFPSIMACRYALASRRLGLFDAPHSLAEILQSNGYATLGFNAANPYVSRYFQYHRGFDHFKDYVALPADRYQALTKRDNGRSTQQASPETYEGTTVSIPKLDLRHYVISEENSREKSHLEAGMNAEIFDTLRRVRGKPFFLWVHYMDCHYPYLPQPEPQRLLNIEPISKEENLQLNRTVRENIRASPKRLSKIKDLYDAAIRQSDNKVGEIVLFLKRQGWYESSLVLLTADHGEEFMEHGDLQHKSKLFDELLHVPLIVKPVKLRGSQLRADLVSLLQVAPTILRSVGLEHPFRARSLFEGFHENGTLTPNIFAGASYGPNGHAPVDKDLFNIDPLPKIYGYRDNQWKLTLDRVSTRNLLFNLIADPDETQNVSHKHPDKVRLLQERLLGYARSLEGSRIRSQIKRVRRKLTNDSHSKHALRPSF
ncbi:sulfatase-like hydrolase/transferase [bacterium]|nr:sulfatase-like hydrolase/transferase [bacterium]